MNKDCLEHHIELCLIQQEELLEQNQQKINNLEKLELTTIQQMAVTYCFKKSKISSKNTYLNVLVKFIELGYTEEHLKKTLNFISNNVQAIIHIHINKLIDFFLKELQNDGKTYYRNQFETGTSSGALSKTHRIDWEKNLFNGIYNDSTNEEKVKYGVINLLAHKEGVKTAYAYGNSYMILKKEVNDRLSFVSGDSSMKQLHIATFKHPCIVMNMLDNILLDTLIKVSNGLIPPSTQKYNYIELQVHGPVNIQRDVESFVINRAFSRDHVMINKLNQLRDITNVPFEFM
jgi:hypothetical protein